MCFSLSDDLIIQNGWNKFFLRQALTGVLPPKVARRRWKVGFSVPEKTWMAILRS
ncbi:MAG: asparagine synthase-related protein, partial [Bacillota bacterium]